MITLNLNGKPQDLDLPDDMPLLWALRDVLGMTGTKFGCGLGLCPCRIGRLDRQLSGSSMTDRFWPAELIGHAATMPNDTHGSTLSACSKGVKQ